MNFHQGNVNGHEVMDFFVTILTAPHFFLTSQCNLSTLVKVNRLSLLIESCSAGSKLLAYKFYHGKVNGHEVIVIFYNHDFLRIFNPAGVHRRKK